jgi:ribosomal RNA-processing protein 1
MSDKPLVQQGLATELANLLLIINPIPATSTLTEAEASAERTKAALAFLDGFWKAMMREWSGIDRLRLVVQSTT